MRVLYVTLGSASEATGLGPAVYLVRPAGGTHPGERRGGSKLGAGPEGWGSWPFCSGSPTLRPCFQSCVPETDARLGTPGWLSIHKPSHRRVSSFVCLTLLAQSPAAPRLATGNPLGGGRACSTQSEAGTDLLVVLLLSEKHVQDVSFDLEVPGGAELHVLHQVHLGQGVSVGMGSCLPAPGSCCPSDTAPGPVFHRFPT